MCLKGTVVVVGCVCVATLVVGVFFSLCFSQSWFWQANKAAMTELFGVTTKDLRREEDAAKRAIREQQGSRAQVRPDEEGYN